jgi:hypothetical protein
MMVAADLENEKRNPGPAEGCNQSSPGVAAGHPPTASVSASRP